MGEKTSSNAILVPENRYPGCRGPDKDPRNYNPNSRQNLRQYQKNPESSTNIIENTGNVTSLSSKLLLVGLIFALLVIGVAVVELKPSKPVPERI